MLCTLHESSLRFRHNIWHFIQQRMLCLESPGRDRRAAQGGHKTYRVCEEGPLSAENDAHRRDRCPLHV